MITGKTLTQPLLAAGLALLATGAVASEANIAAYGDDNRIGVTQERGNRADLLLVGDGNVADILQIGRNVDLDVAIVADGTRSHVVTGICPPGRSASPVLVDGSYRLNVVVARCR